MLLLPWLLEELPSDLGRAAGAQEEKKKKKKKKRRKLKKGFESETDKLDLIIQLSHISTHSCQDESRLISSMSILPIKPKKQTAKIQDLETKEENEKGNYLSLDWNSNWDWDWQFPLHYSNKHLHWHCHSQTVLAAEPLLL